MTLARSRRAAVAAAALALAMTYGATTVAAPTQAPVRSAVGKAAPAQAEAARPVASPPHPHIEGPTRPIIGRVDELDYTSLPLMEDVALVSGEDESFRIELVREDHRYTMPAGPTWIVSSVGRDAVLRIGDVLVPTGRPIGWSEPEARSEAEWFVLDRGRLSGDRAALKRLEGSFTNAAARATRASKVRARALVPWQLYAYRRCTAGCDHELGSPERIEEIGVVAPPSLWDGTSGNAARHLELHDVSTFTALSAPVSPGSSATLVVDVAKANEKALAAVTKPSSDGTTTFELEVMWQDGPIPTLTLFTGTIDGAPAEVSPGSHRRRK